MPEIGTSSSMSGDGKRSVGHRPQTTAPVLDSTEAAEMWCCSKSAAISDVLCQVLRAQLSVLHAHGVTANDVKNLN